MAAPFTPSVPERGTLAGLVLVLVAVCCPLLPAVQGDGPPEIPAPPEFLGADQLGLLDGYREQLAANLEQHSEYVSRVNEKYLGALGRARDRMIKLGATRAIEAIDGEVERIEAGDTARSDAIDAAPDYVREMRGQYEKFIQRVGKLHRSRDAEARVEVDAGLSQLQVALTRANKLEQAVAIRDYREVLRRPPEPPKPEVDEPDLPPDVTPSGSPDPPVFPRPPIPDPPRPVIPDPPGVTPPDTDDRDYEFDVPRPLTAEEFARFGGELGPKPVRGTGGYAPMVDSIRNRQVTEISLGKIKRWGPVQAKMWKGKPYWTATVTYPTTSLFGTFDTEGLAVMNGDRVLGWFYTGSGEQIP